VREAPKLLQLEDWLVCPANSPLARTSEAALVQGIADRIVNDRRRTRRNRRQLDGVSTLTEAAFLVALTVDDGPNRRSGG